MKINPSRALPKYLLLVILQDFTTQALGVISLRHPYGEK